MVLKGKTPIVVFFFVSIAFFTVNVVTQYIFSRPEVNLSQAAVWSVFFGVIFGGYSLLKK